MITVNFNLLNFKNGYKILDIGCGSGRHMVATHQIIITLTLKNITIVGSDISLKDLHLAKENMLLQQTTMLENSYKNWELILSDITNLPFSSEYFDLIICSEVLEHVRNDEYAIKELARVLNPGGTLVITVPRYWPEKICWKLSDDYANSDQKHLRIYQKKTLINLLKCHGLLCNYTHYSHSLHTPFWILKCLTGLKVKDPLFVDLYHKFLVWDMMKKPAITKLLDLLLNPFFGKSLVLYTTKSIK